MKQRKIKFRIWDGIDFTTAEFLKQIELSPRGNHFIPLLLNGFTENDKFIIQEFTGLKDKKGKEIYEGDILNVNPKWVAYKNKNKLVTFDKGQFLLDNLRLYEYCSGYEIVGNIFQNPELLGK